ncbi:6-carboxytetrahydropterin synthase [Thermosynechococcaceae cyanobacterium BACA0444]|uniref:6-carboxy-5,6,7,8-tetrahydropterin synthase n=1 Tax=Pseudocalidococcus azoricus BACA0444 TaxID=2918990 RepID=A0AAE4JWK0_9CYAN|nr:6-carboxytetrahydropterin synthase [Pseudocalidococcus azoricus]MDS3861465.1 6-carboxytetrahydropterin synthase [Pseudocalidococcus azoricus BACA0444]
MFRLEIRHNLEMAHRFYQAENSPKCRSIHGHSWQVILTLRAPQLNPQAMVIEFGELKLVWRAWLDQNLDHALLLYQGDPVVKLLQAHDPDLRLFTLTTDPTTECLAEFLYHQAQQILTDLNADPQIQVERLRIEETAINSAEYLP